MDGIYYRAFDLALALLNVYIFWMMRRIQINKKEIEVLKETNKDQVELNNEQGELIKTMKKRMHILEIQANACMIRDNHLNEQIKKTTSQI